MLSLTVTQPWATLIVTGRKKVETRRWGPVYRGRIVIHAAAGWSADDREFARSLGLDPAALPLGAALGTVRIRDVQATDRIRETLDVDELALGDYSDGRKAWVLETPSTFPAPVPCRGALGLWSYIGNADGTPAR